MKILTAATPGGGHVGASRARVPRPKRVVMALSVIVVALTLGMAATAVPASAWDPGTPEHEDVGDVAIQGVGHVGLAFFDDYDANIQGQWDVDDFYIQDEAGDGLSVSLSVYHNGEKYSEHAYYGDTERIDVGNIRDGETVKLKACAWKDGSAWGWSCAESEYTE